MKLRRKLAAALCLALIACLAAQVALPSGAGIVTEARAASKVKLSKTKATLYAGQKLQLKLKNAKGKISWSSSAKKVATVDKNGQITAKTSGTAKITAKLGKVKYTCRLTVKPAMTASATSLKLAPGKARVIALTLNYKDGISASWDNAGVISCAQSKMTAKGKGYTFTITVKALAGGEATLTVWNKKCAGKAMEKLKIRVLVGDGAASAEPQELCGFMGKTVKAANKTLKLKLEAAQMGYANQCFGAFLDSDGRIEEIQLYGGEGRYTLFSVWPGMEPAKADEALRGQGWQPGGHDTAGDLYFSEADAAHAIRLECDAGGALMLVTYLTL